MAETDTQTADKTGTDLSNKEADKNLPVVQGGTGLTMDQKRANPFSAIAMILSSVRLALQQPKEGTKVPRWIRIARIRNFQGGSDYIAKGVIYVVDLGLISGISYLVDLTLKAKDLLFQADAAKALWEVSEEMLLTVTDDKFSEAVAQIWDPNVKNPPNPLSAAQPYIKQVGGFIDKIPTPEDLELIGGELFGMMCLEQLPLDDTGLSAATSSHINLATSGKIRLLQMALTAKTSTDPNLVKSITVRSLGKDKTGSQPISWLGGRRLIKNVAPTLAKGVFGEGEASETVYEFSYEGDQVGKDIEEVNILLEKMGYPALSDKKTFTDEFVTQLKRFQTINGLPVTGALDNDTLNRFWHLDFKGKTLKRAEPFDALKLPDELKPK